MSDVNTPSLDAGGEARRALQEAIREYGTGVLSQPQTLNNFFKDQLGEDSRREASLLVSAAGADVAGILHQHLDASVDPDTAVQFTSTTFAESRDLVPAAAAWAVGEFAGALGHSPGQRSETIPPPPSPTEDDRTVSRAAAPPAPQWPAPGTMQPAGQQATTPPATAEPTGQPTSWPPSPGGTRKSRPGWLPPVIIGGIVVAGVVIYLIVAAVAGLPPFSSSAPPPSPTSNLTASSWSCSNVQPPSGVNFSGLTQSQECTTSSLPGGQTFIYQFDNTADLNNGLNTYNQFKPFFPAAAGNSCPPSGNSISGLEPDSEPGVDVLECLTVQGRPTYIWTVPSKNAIYSTQAAQGSAFSSLDDWWNNAHPDGLK